MRNKRRACARSACPAYFAAPIGRLGRHRAVLLMTAHARSAADFTQHSEVAYAASGLLQAVLGKAGAHSKTSVCAQQVPKNASVELSFAVKVC